MKKFITPIYRMIVRKHVVKNQETLRREYEEAMHGYDHYIAFGSAFMNFCGGK